MTHSFPSRRSSDLHADVAARAKAATLAVIDHDRLHRRLLPPRQQRLDHVFADAERERVQRLGPIERDPPDAALDANDDIFGDAHDRTRLRPTIIRITSLVPRSEEHTSELQSLMRISYAVFCLKKKNKQLNHLTLLR